MLEKSTARLEDRIQELGELLPRVDALLSRNGKVRMDECYLVVSPLEAEERRCQLIRIDAIPR
jgi:hypothetical protein